jgi:hypothetical protein
MILLWIVLQDRSLSRALQTEADHPISRWDCRDALYSAGDRQSHIGGWCRLEGGARSGGRTREQLTPQQQAERQKAAEELKKWRLSQSMDKFREMRKMFNGAGVSTYAHKQTPTMAMSDEEWEYFFLLGKALGADHLTQDSHLRFLAAWKLSVIIQINP